MSPAKFYHDLISQELSTAHEAAALRNHGKSRVCARRAVGHALRWFLEHHPNRHWGSDVITQLTNLKNDTTFPQPVREAAARLTTKISDRFSYPFSNDPIEDAQSIITHIESLMRSFHD